MHRLAPLRTDEQLEDEFDDLMILACNGDRRALGAIAIAFTSTLLEEARAELGGLEKHAAEVVAEALTTISEGAGGFDPTRERATRWMKRLVRNIARTTFTPSSPPQSRNSVPSDRGVASDHGEPLLDGLGDEHAIERIAMMQRQRPDANRMRESDGELVEASLEARAHDFVDVRR